MRIIDIAVMYGYNSQEAFKEVYNVPPHTYRINKMLYDNVGQICNRKIHAIDMFPHTTESKRCTFYYLVPCGYGGTTI